MANDAGLGGTGHDGDWGGGAEGEKMRRGVVLTFPRPKPRVFAFGSQERRMRWWPESPHQDRSKES